MKLLIAVVCAILLAGVTCSTTPVVRVSKNAGEEYAFSVLTIQFTVASCHLKTPAGEILNFIPGEAPKYGDRYEFHPPDSSESLPSCAVIVKNLRETDNGHWEMSAQDAVGAERSQSFELIVSGTEVEEDEVEDDNVKIFNAIEFPTRTGQTIDISLPKIDHEENCFILTPDGGSDRATEVKIEGVTVHTSSNFVSCRITIGPMVDSLLGEWSICGTYTENDEEYKRCQPAKIFWNNVNHPGSDWVITPQPRADHPVHFGHTLTPVVIGLGNIVSCHAITPNGEDLVINQDSEYPGITAETLVQSICGIAIGPINASKLGNWTVYGLFRNAIDGLNEVRLPINMYLYDEENPYNQAYNVTVLDPVKRVVNLGSTLNIEVYTSAGHVDNCQFETPTQQIFDTENEYNFLGASFVKEDTRIACQLAIGPITDRLLGDWKLTGKFSNNGRFTELQQTFQVLLEDPKNPIEENRTIVNLNHQTVETEIGKPHRFVIESTVFIDGESCHIRTPDGLQYTIMEGFNLAGVEVIEEYGVECGVIINVIEDVVGNWTLIARATRFSVPIERRLPFTIYVEATSENSETDETESSITTLNLVRDRSIEKAVGPENAVYCRLEDPQGVAVFDGFGRCSLNLDKVGLEHHGVWKMLVGVLGRVHADEYHLNVNVRESENKAVVTTHVEQQKPLVTVSCAIQTDAAVSACKFRNPQGKILLATSTLSQDSYSSGENTVSYESEMKTNECIIRITNPLVTDLGLWRCAIETSEDTYYGHIAVLCPWALSNPAIAATVQQEPLLTSDRSLVSVVEEEPATISCSIQAAIRYCYFRAANGTTFTVAPGMSSSAMEYAGAGFDAGECGVRFHGMQASDSGRWSCHVGLLGSHTEQRAQFQLTVHERMRVNHYYSHSNVMTVEGIVHEGRALEYCRFVRIDGFGFTTDSVPPEYTVNGILTNGECQFTARDPTILDLHPWTVAARIRGQAVEISKDTMEAILITPPPEGNPPGAPSSQRGLSIFFYVFMCTLLVSILLGVMLGPKKNRDWTSQRASAFRRSLTSSFRKQPPMLYPVPSNNNTNTNQHV